jgi:hypothetical protein
MNTGTRQIRRKERRTWEVKVATNDDFSRWMDFVVTVQEEFHGLDLTFDEYFRSVITKNIARKTAIYPKIPLFYS